MEELHVLIGYANDYYAFYIMLFLGLGLILIDYVFPVDWPCYFGYLFLALSSFFAAPMNILYSTVCFVAVFALLMVGHKLLFTRFLANAPHVRRRGDFL